MSVRLRILISMISIAVFGVAALLAAVIVLFSKSVDSSIEDELDRVTLEVTRHIESLKSISNSSTRYFANDFIIVHTMGKEKNMFLNRMAQLLNDTSVDFCGFVDNDEMSLLLPQRYRSLEVFEDDLRKMTSIQYAFSRRWGYMTTLDYGTTVKLSVCTGVRVHYSDGSILGAIVTGFRLDTKDLVNELKSLTGCEISIFIGNDLIATTLGNGADRSVTPKKTPDNMITRSIPLTDYDGREMGVVVAGQFLTHKTETVRAFIITGIIVTISILGVSSILIILLIRRVSRPIDEMMEKIHYDALTGIFNRRYFDETLNYLIKMLSRSGGTISLLMIDIDFFKNFNDTYGHGEGDMCLKMVANAIVGCTTRSADFVARYGGEEFCAVLPNADEAGAIMVAEKMLEAVSILGIPHGKSDAADHVTISIGVTTGNVNHLQNADEYIKSADDMLYQSKNKGRNRYTFKAM